MNNSLTITRPDDWHIHFRDNEVLKDTVNASGKHFARGLIMPNLVPPLTQKEQILAYRERILSVLEHHFTPYMTYYLNESVSPDELASIRKEDPILGAKLYPAGATTNSELGAKSLSALYPQLEAMQDNSLVLQIHGEATTGDIFEREPLFISQELNQLAKNFPKLRIILEHISTKQAVEFITQAPDNVAATITVHHLLYNRNKLLVGGIRPHYYCLPILKHERDQNALLKAATSGNPKFFLGTDSAPHEVDTKQSACGCAGIYSSPFALALYTQVFEECSALNRLNDFASRFGAEFYQLPINQEQIELVKKEQTIPHQLNFGNAAVVPIAAGETISWSVNENS